jgi:ATP-binding cassette, subfamily C (CFTR/MRP), member 1
MLFICFQTVNFFSPDAERFLFVMPAIQNLFLVPIYVVYCLVYLWLLLGYSVAAGCIVMGICMYASAYASGILKKLQAAKSRFADARMEATEEAIGGVQV